VSGKLKTVLSWTGIFLIAGVLYYFLYYIKTPEYSIGMIQIAIENHDTDTFDKLVDLRQVYSGIFDDEIKANAKGNINAAGFLMAFKSLAINQYIDDTKQAILSTDKYNGTKSFRKLQNNSGYKGSKVSSVLTLKKEGNIAIVGVVMLEESEDQKYRYDLTMRKLPDGYWQLITVSKPKD
jgi:hypothetical protein